MENGKICWRYKGRSCGVEISDCGDIYRLAAELGKLAEDMEAIREMESQDIEEREECDYEIMDCLTLIRCALSMYFDRVIGREAKLEMFAERDNVQEYLEALVSFTQFTNKVIDRFIEKGERLLAQTRISLSALSSSEQAEV